MELICPDCRAGLVIADAQNATCTAHNGRYQILFDRASGTSYTVQQQPQTESPVLAATPASIPLVVEDPNVKYCGQCGVANALTAQRCSACSTTFTLLNLSTRPVVRESPPNLQCQQHPDVQAVVRCRICLRGVCATCDFLLPGDVHVCPACLEREPATDIAPRRRTQTILGLIFAVISTFILLLTESPTVIRSLRSDPAALGVVGCLVMITTVAGLILAFTAFDRRLRNSTLIWVVVVWNSVNFGYLVLRAVINNVRR